MSDPDHDLRDDVMTLDAYGSTWVLAEDYRALLDAKEAAEADLTSYIKTANELAQRCAEAEAKLEVAVKVLEQIDRKISWEINPSNYDHAQVCNMNSDWCEIGDITSATLAQIQPKEGTDNDG